METSFIVPTGSPQEIEVWHFVRDPRFMRDGTLIEVGKIYTVPWGKVIPCVRGYHGSIDPLDALSYSPGVWLGRRTLWGRLIPHSYDGGKPDKIVGASCKILRPYKDATQLLTAAGRWFALQVIHLCPEIENETRLWLETGDVAYRSKAYHFSTEALAGAPLATHKMTEAKIHVVRAVQAAAIDEGSLSYLSASEAAYAAVAAVYADAAAYADVYAPASAGALFRWRQRLYFKDAVEKWWNDGN